MELPDFLTAKADRTIADKIPPLNMEAAGVLAQNMNTYVDNGRSAEEAQKLRDLGDGLISGPKGYGALGAFDATERQDALDQLGFSKQFVFSSLSTQSVFDPNMDPAVAYGGCRAHNRGMAEFCADERLVGVGLLSLDNVERAIEELDYAVSLGIEAMWIPHRLAGGRSPGHTDLDPLWARFVEHSIPFLLHVGGAALKVAPGWLDNGRPVPNDWLGGGENIRSKDMLGLHHGAEQFLSVMVLDGVLERFPDLRGGVIELGAGWVPSMLTRIDYVAGIWSRSEPLLKEMQRTPSQQIIDQVKFTPFVFEDVGSIINASDSRLYMFSSDYPHIEGGRDPLARFGRTLEGQDDETLDRFYTQNFADLVGIA
jgi:predicted TIM-barrel fold metal-dependent hydrolase